MMQLVFSLDSDATFAVGTERDLTPSGSGLHGTQQAMNGFLF